MLLIFSVLSATAVCFTLALAANSQPKPTDFPGEAVTSNPACNVTRADETGDNEVWTIVNVEKPGEFADAYLTQNNNDWGASTNLKVTGNVNENDLNTIKELTNLAKLDISELVITELPEGFLYNKDTITEVKLPASLRTIGRVAFSYCNSLASINLSGVKKIGDNAFNDCTALNNIDITSAEIIEYSAFYQCSSLNNIVFCDNLKELGSSSFYNTNIETITIPEGITTIESGAFAYCSNLRSVSLPSALKRIESSAFYGCSSLTEATIPATVTEIGSSAFWNTGIKNFKCYATVPPVANGSFIGGHEIDMTDVYLYVPPFSKDFYRNTNYWKDFYLMRSIEDDINYIFVDRKVDINLEEEDNAVLANNPRIDLSYSYNNSNIGQLTATGAGTLSAGQFAVAAQLSNRQYRYYYNYVPTLINYADKMRADNVSHSFSFYESNADWHFISLPYDVKVSEIVPSNDTFWVIRRYDSAARAAGESDATWVNLTTDDIMEAGKGYIVSAVGGEKYVDENGNDRQAKPQLTFISGNTTTKNNIFRSTDITVPLTEYTSEFAHNRSWNFVGNPYPCYFDMHYLNEGFTAPVTVWSGASYIAYSPVDDNLVLAPYEAFFVQCPLDASEMTFRVEGRLHSDEGKNSYNANTGTRASVSTDDRNVFNFTISDGTSEDRTRIVINREASADYEIGRDASKFFASNASCAQIYVAGDVNYSISERPLGDGTATLGLRSAEEKEYTLSLSGHFSTDWEVVLTDTKTGESVNLAEKPYNFIAENGDTFNRFLIRFGSGSNGEAGVDAITDGFAADSIVTVTNVYGIKVFSGNINEIKVPAAGIYIISDGKETRKVILK